MKLIRILFIFLFSINLYATISLSEKEKEWIKNNPIIKVGIDKNWPPFEYVDKSNNHKGISSEYLEQISLRTGLNFELYPNKWTEVMDSIKNKQIDILACAANTKQRREFLNFTDSYIDIDIAVVVRNNLHIESFEDIKNYKIALPKDNFIHEALKKRFPKATFIFTKSNEEALEYVSYKKADIYVGNLPVISYFIEKNFLTNLTIAFKAPLKKVNLSMGVLKEKKVLLSILNKVLKSIGEEEKNKIARRWVNLKSVSKVNNSFSLMEKKWILENENIKMAGDTNWPPYSFLNEKGKYVGIIPDLVNEVFKDSNINIEFIKTEKWTDTLELFENKEVDIIDAISYSPSRSKYANFSTKFLGSEIVFISTKKHEAYVGSVSSIKDKKIGTIKGYSVVEKINKDYPNIDLFLYDMPLLGLKALISGEVDYFLLDIPSFDYYNKKHGFSNLKIAGPAGYSYSYGFAVQKDNPLFLSIVNKLLSNVSQSRKVICQPYIILRKYNF